MARALLPSDHQRCRIRPGFRFGARALSLLLTLTLTLSSALADPPAGLMPEPPSDAAQAESFDFLDESLSQAFRQSETAQFQATDPLLTRAQAYFEQGIAFHKAELDRLGPEEFRNQLERGNLAIREGDVRIELNNIDGQVFIRVLFDSVQRAFVFLDVERINPISKHLRQYISRQHLDSQRDVTTIWAQDSNPVKVQTIEIPRAMTPQWWHEYWWKIYKAPNKGDAYMSIFCAAAQAGVSACIRGIKTLSDPKSGFDFKSAALASAFAVVMGTYNSTRKNWFDMSSEKTLPLPGGRALTIKKGVVEWSKRFSLSLVYSLLYVGLMDPMGLGALNPATHKGMEKLGKTLFNASFSNVSSRAWDEYPKALDTLRETTGKFSFRLPWHRDPIQITRANVERQAWYLIPFTLRQLDLFLMNVNLVTPFGTLPAGPMVMLGGVVVAKYIAYKKIARMVVESRHLVESDPSPANLERLRKVEERYEAISKSWITKIGIVTTWPVRAAWNGALGAGQWLWRQAVDTLFSEEIKTFEPSTPMVDPTSEDSRPPTPPSPANPCEQSFLL